jgi:hypothetical protein
MGTKIVPEGIRIDYPCQLGFLVIVHERVTNVHQRYNEHFRKNGERSWRGINGLKAFYLFVENVLMVL